MYKTANKYNYLLGIVLNIKSINAFLNRIIEDDKLNIKQFNDTFISNETIELINNTELINNNLSNIYIKNIKSIFNENTLVMTKENKKQLINLGLISINKNKINI